MNPKILQVGLGGFGRNHLRAWNDLGLVDNLFLAELDPTRHRECRSVGLQAARIRTDYYALLDEVDVVDIVTPSTSHFQIAKTALQAGKDVFIEKPMTMTSAESLELATLVKETGRLVQVGYYYRFHPISLFLTNQLRTGELGDLRYLSGNFMGFKRARTDVGVTHTDGVHFIDLFNWLVGVPPVRVYAVARDHFRRGMEDVSVVLLHYPAGTMAKVESGYIQPGRWHDKVVPNAMTTKEIFVCGSRATSEADFETETAVVHDVRHEFNQITWAPVGDGSRVPNLGTASPVQMVAAELRAFLDCVAKRERPACDVIAGGVVMAKLMEAIYESSRRDMPVHLEWTGDEARSIGAQT